jgi:hypothetical protein
MNAAWRRAGRDAVTSMTDLYGARTMAEAQMRSIRRQEVAVRRAYVERTPGVLDRMLAMADPSGRESNRVVTIWQSCVRRLSQQQPISAHPWPVSSRRAAIWSLSLRPSPVGPRLPVTP